MISEPVKEPCPFCGSVALLIISHGGDERDGYSVDGRITCDNDKCSATMEDSTQSWEASNYKDGNDAVNAMTERLVARWRRRV
jgi:hypothetical protein